MAIQKRASLSQNEVSVPTVAGLTVFTEVDLSSPALQTASSRGAVITVDIEVASGSGEHSQPITGWVMKLVSSRSFPVLV